VFAFPRLPSAPEPQDPPPSPDVSGEEGDDERLRDWRIERFEEMGFAYPWALELAVGGADWHDCVKLLTLLSKAGYDEPTAREMAAEILR